MIRIVGSDLKKLQENGNPFVHLFETERVLRGDQIIGVYRGEEVFLCPYLIIDRERGICDTCKYRFECFTDKWGLPDE